MRNKTDNKKKALISNSFFFFTLTGINYLVYFITLPYQARILGPDLFGLVSFTISITALFQVFVEYGFMNSTIERISLARDDRKSLSAILSSVLFARLLIFMVGLAIIIPIILLTDLKEHLLLIILFFLANTSKSFLPDFLFKGIENIKPVAIRTGLVQILSTVALFLLLKTPSDILWIPTLILIGSGVSIFLSSVLLRKEGIKLILPSISGVLYEIKHSFPYFISRSASYMYSSSNAFFIGLVYGAASTTTGLYTSADRLSLAIKQLVNPIGDSLFPYMVKNRDFKLIKVLTLALLVIGISLSCIIYIYSEEIVTLIFGDAFLGSSRYLAILSITIPVMYVSQILGFATLAPLGLSRHVNISTTMGFAAQIGTTLTLLATGSLTATLVCIVVCATESLVLAYRSAILLIYLSKNRSARVSAK